jgi:hypothetical protein
MTDLLHSQTSSLSSMAEDILGFDAWKLFYARVQTVFSWRHKSDFSYEALNTDCELNEHGHSGRALAPVIVATGAPLLNSASSWAILLSNRLAITAFYYVIFSKFKAIFRQKLNGKCGCAIALRWATLFLGRPKDFKSSCTGADCIAL